MELIKNAANYIKEKYSEDYSFTLKDELIQEAKKYFPNFRGDVTINENMIYFNGGDLKVPFNKVGAYYKNGETYHNGSSYHNTLELAKFMEKKLQEKLDLHPEKELFYNDNGQTYEVIQRSISGKNALLKDMDDSVFQPYVCAFRAGNGSWGQGHYFSDFEDAEKYFKDNLYNESMTNLNRNERNFLEKYDFDKSLYNSLIDIVEYYKYDGYDNREDIIQDITETFKVTEDVAEQILEDYKLL